MWTDENVEQLKKLWTEGASASEISRALGNGLSRNAVLGKVHRMGMADRAVVSRRVARPYAIRPNRPRLVEAPAHASPLLLDAIGVPYTTLSIEYGMCRYPFDAPDVDGGVTYCAHAVTGGGESWCAYHHSRCLVPLSQNGHRKHSPETIAKMRASQQSRFARAA